MGVPLGISKEARAFLGTAFLMVFGVFAVVAYTFDQSYRAEHRPFGINARQAIKVVSKGGFLAEVTALEKVGIKSKPVFDPMPATVGRNGLIAADQKKEGDGCTPKGTYNIGRAFGYAPSIDTKLDYFQATKSDLWVDDPAHADYNRLVKAPTTAKSFEHMKRDDDCYELGAVIQYNTNPVVPGKGSAIFLHVWSGPNKPTAGCVALERKHVAQLLKWLDKSKNPVIIIGD